MNSYSHFRPLANLHTGSEDLGELALEYQADKDPVKFAYVFVTLYPLIRVTVERYFYLTDEDKESLAIEELHRSMLDFRSDGGAQLQTLFTRYLTRRMYSATKMANHQKRKANNGAECFGIVSESSTQSERGYGEVEFAETLVTTKGLTENELRYCRLIMSDSDHTHGKDSDAARVLGITPAAIHYIKKALARKLSPLAV